MASTLLDELPCYLDEADELMARLSFHATLLKGKHGTSSGTSSMASSRANGDSTDQDLAQHNRDLQSSRSRSTSEAVHSADVQAVDTDTLKFFGKHFLSMQSTTIDKMSACLPVGAVERKALLTSAMTVYQLMKRIQHWQQTSWDSLTRFFLENSRSDASLLTYDSHPQLTRLVLATVAKCIKLHLLWSSFNLIPGMLALYSFLQHVEKTGDSTSTPNALYSPLECTDHRVREFVLRFGSTPLLAIQQDFQRQVSDSGASLAALAFSCFDIYNSCRDLATLRNQGVFDLESLVGGGYASHPSLPGLLNCADIADWVICAVLCVPHQLLAGLSSAEFAAAATPPSSPTGSTPSSSQLWKFMETIARDRLVLNVHRDYVVNVHDLIFQQVTSSLAVASSAASPKASSSRPSSVSLKKAMTSLSKQALRTCGSNHRQRREVATWLLHNCVQLMTHNPGLVAPAFPLLLAALAIARDEIEWAICHSVCSSTSVDAKAGLVPRHVKSKYLQRVLPSFTGAESEVADLLSSCHRLRALIELHAQFLVEYYQTFLINGDADGIAYSINELLEQNGSTSDMRSLLKGFLDREHYRVDISSTTRATWVREWRQANAHFVTGAQQLSAVRERMEGAVRHSEYICATDQLISHAADFSKCWWFKEFVFEQCFHQTLTLTPQSSTGLLEILSRLAEGDYTLKELVDRDEAVLQSAKMAVELEQMETNILNQLELGLEAIVRRDRVRPGGDKTEQVEPRVTSRTSRLSSFSRSSVNLAQRNSSAELRLASPTSLVFGRNNDSRILPPKFGNEDSNSAEARCLTLARALLDHLMQYYENSRLKSALIHRVQANFIRLLRDVVTCSGVNNDPALKCSIRDVCEEIRNFFRITRKLFGGRISTKDADNGSSLLGDELQTALAKTLEDEQCSPTSIPPDKTLLEWATNGPHVNEKELQQWRLVDRLTWLYLALATRKCHSVLSSSAFPSILISTHRNCLAFHPDVLGQLDPRDYTDRGALQHLVGLIGSTGVDAICSTIANMLVVLTLKLRSTLEAEYAALVAIETALSGSSNLAGSISQFRALDDIADQLIRVGSAIFLLQLLHDHSNCNSSKSAWEARVLPRVLRELQQDADRRATWTRLLPVACAVCFHASIWDRTTYLSNVEATDTNAHLMGLAMARLLPAPHTSPAAHRCAVAALARSSACSDGLAQPRPRRKRPLQPGQSGSETVARPLLEALELLVTAASSPGGIIESVGPAGSVLADLELVLERLLPRAVLVLHSLA